MTDPTITIAGLRAQVESLQVANRESIAMWTEAVEDFDELAAQADGLTAERDALAAQLAEVRKVAAELDRDLSNAWTERERAATVAERDNLRADLASERAHLAACRTRIAGLESAANERSAEVARLTAERTEWIAAAVAIGEHVDHLGPVASGGGDIAPREWIHYAQDLAGRVKARIAGDGRPCNGSCDIALASRQVGPDGIVPRNARECAELWEREAARLWREETRLTARVAELEARPVNARAALISVLTATKHGPGGRGGPGDCDADCVKCEAERALASLGAPPTSPPAARPVFAGVSASDLDVAYIGGQRECHRRHEGAIKDCCRYAAVAAVLARLKVSLVAPVDPEAVAREYGHALGEPPWAALDAEVARRRTAAMRATLIARGIPVTPEVGK